MTSQYGDQKRRQSEIISLFNRTEVRFPFVPVHEQIRRQAELHPEKTAVICSGESVSYEELNALSDRAARGLMQGKAGREGLIGVLFEREAANYIAELAILKSGAGFLPFIPEYPDERIAYCMRDSSSKLLITTAELREKRSLRDASFEVVTLEELMETAELSGHAEPFPQVKEDDPAYCIYTSGTTGRPKGVLIEHGNIANYVHNNEKSIEIMQLAAPGRISLALASFSFDFSLEEELVPLCHGNTVVIASGEQIHDPVKFAEMVYRTGVDAMSCTPTYLCGLLSVRESREALKQIRLYHIGAEAFPPQLYSMLRELRKDSVIMNVYGPTECTIISSGAVVQGDETVTVGRPRANVQYHVFDPEGNELPVGEKGELIICGKQVGRGYIGRNAPEGAFFTFQGEPAYHSGDLASWTDSGEIVIHGRIDSQIKLHGYRIELNEIEKVMAECPEIQRAAVALKKRPGFDCLVGYYTANQEIDRLRLKQHMKARLPDYMIPRLFVRLEEMPATLNGKIDRNRLPEPAADALKADYVPPRTDREKKLCTAMEKVLRLPARSVGLLDDFFDLSGDSISAMELLAEAGLRDLTYTDVFTFRTPAEILGALDRRANSLAPQDLDRLEEAARSVPHRLTPVQTELMDVQLFIPRGATVSSIRFLMRLDDTVNPLRFRDALNKALANHPGFAMKFFFDAENELMQQYDPLLVPHVEIRQILPSTEEALGDILIRPFDRLLNQSLCRANLFQGKWGLYFFMDVHHLLMDGFSIRPFFQDIVDAYQEKELKKDYYLALLDREEKRNLNGQYDADRECLLNRYGGSDWCAFPFTADPLCMERGGEFLERLRFHSLQVQQATERLSVSLSVLHMASILLAMHRMTGKTDVMVFWTFHNRQTKEAEDAVGMPIQTLPVGCHMDEIPSLGELLLSIREQVISGVAHNGYSYLVEQVFNRRKVWVESNLQAHMNGAELDFFHPEYLELENVYTETADNTILAIISEKDPPEDGYDIFLSHRGRGISRKQVERLHREIKGILETLILDDRIGSERLLSGLFGASEEQAEVSDS